MVLLASLSPNVEIEQQQQQQSNEVHVSIDLQVKAVRSTTNYERPLLHKSRLLA